MPVPSVFLSSQRRRRYLRAGYPFAIAAICLWYLFQRLDGFNATNLGTLAGTVGIWNWVGALAATALSFWAVARYDGLAHRHFGTPVPDDRARRAGAVAIAFSQTMGFGLATGAFARWQLLPGLSPLAALRLTLFVAVSFLAALGVVICSVSLLVPAAVQVIPTWVALAGIAAAGATALLAFARPIWKIGKLHFHLPSLPAMSAIAGWTLLDTAAAAMALTLLLPPQVGLGFDVVFPAYLLALRAALVSGSPGGVGPFELTLLALVPFADAHAMMAGIVAYRTVYFALPALLAGAILLRAHRRARRIPRAQIVPTTAPAPVPASACAETGVLRQNGGRMLSDAVSTVACVGLGQCLVGLFDPARGKTAAALLLLMRSARIGNRVPCLYKCNARTAAAARRGGWISLRIAQEAVIDPADFDLGGRKHRQIRRKLRHAQRAGIRIVHAGQNLPLETMAKVDRCWQSTHGTARGTTMGRFEATYVSTQAVFLARNGDALVGFVTFHATRNEWCLDLMRPAPDAPDGTMHALICEAIAHAGTLNIPRLSLAALPDHPLSRLGAPGLAQFKRSFAPRLEPRYLCAPNLFCLVMAVADIARAVRWPGPLQSTESAATRLAHEDHEQNGIAFPPGP